MKDFLQTIICCDITILNVFSIVVIGGVVNLVLWDCKKTIDSIN